MVNEDVEDANGDIPENAAAEVGPRGGLSYDTYGNQDQSALKGFATNGGYPPTYILIGPGVDMAFFRTGNGFNIKYNGPYCEEAIALAKQLSSGGATFKDIIDELCNEFNCKIVNEGEKI